MSGNGGTWRSGARNTYGRRRMEAYARFWNPQTHIPCQNPPFGELIAVDLTTGDIAWRSVLGTVEALEAIGVHNTGAPNIGGSIATAGGLVFIGATNDSRFRAFDSKTGKLLWEGELEASGHTSPITYMGRDGRQYVALMATGGGSYLGGRFQQQPGRLRVAGYSSEAAACRCLEGGCGSRGGKARTASSRKFRARRAPNRRGHAAGREDVRDRLSFGRSGNQPAPEPEGMERACREYGEPRRPGDRRPSESHRRLSRQDAEPLTLCTRLLLVVLMTPLFQARHLRHALRRANSQKTAFWEGKRCSFGRPLWQRYRQNIGSDFSGSYLKPTDLRL